MLVLIFGAFGMLGSSIIHALERRKIAYIATDKKDVDIADLEALRSFVKGHSADVMINCAAYTNVDQAEKEPNEAHLVNTIGAENVGIVSKEFGAKAVHFSTDYIFDGKKKTPYRETDKPMPQNVYGRTKYEGEQLLLKQNSDALIIRTSWLFGSNGKHFISTMINLFQGQNEVNVVSDQIGRPTYAKDLAEACLTLLPYSGIYHYANEEVVSWYDLASFLFKEMQKHGPLPCKMVRPMSSAKYQSLATRPLNSGLDTSKYEEIFGEIRPWKKAVSEYLKESLRLTCV